MLDWKVLYVKPRCEKKVGEYCRIFGIPHYLPVCEKRRIVQRRKVLVTMPVFPGYVFAEFSSSGKLRLIQTNLLVRILEPGRSSRLARDLVMIRRALRATPELSAEPPLTKGVRVRIIDGPFMGVEGIVACVRNKMRVMLNVEIIGQAIAVSAQISQVEVIKEN